MLTVLGLGLVASTAPAAAFGAPEPGLERLAAALDAEAAGDQTLQRYIVVLDEPPLASYRGGIKGLAPTAVDSAGGKVVDGVETVHLDAATPAAKAYLAYLAARQETVLQQLRYLAPELDAQDWRYSIVLNGFAARMTPQSAARALRMDGIRLVYPSEPLYEEMDSTQNLIGTVHAWEAAGGTAEAGLGARVATLEFANSTLHQFFNDEGMPAPPDGYPSATAYLADGSEVDLLAMSANPEALVNDKFIGFRIFAEGLSQAAMQSYANGFSKSGHGTHVAGTIGGRYGRYEILDGVEVEMGGVAPNAWLFAYPVFGETPEEIKAFETMALEEIDAVNLSLGTTTWLMDRPETHPLSLAMSGAADANVLVVGSAGNAGGNGRTSLSGGWKYSEDLMVVGNTSSNGRTFLGMHLDDAPDELTLMAVGLRGARFPDPVTGEMIFLENGGCEADASVAGKIVVVERFDADGNAIGDCAYDARATVAKDNGAVAILYIYYDRATGGASATALDLPGVAVGTDYAETLAGWMRAGNTTTATIDNIETRDYLGTPDLLAGSSSRGPGIDWTIKPDISAPGTDIISSVLEDSNTQDDLPPDVSTWPAYSGTSMAAPHITGSAGLLRSMHPNWSVEQLRSAMINTSVATILTGDPADPRPADPTEGGPGRINLTDAYDPRAFLYPPKASFGAVGPGEENEIEILIESDSDEAITWDLSVTPGAGDAAVRVEPDSLRLLPGDVASFTVYLDSDGVSEHEHWGDVVLQQREPAPPGIYLPALVNGAELGTDAPEGGVLAGGESPAAIDHEGEEEDMRTLRLVYYAYVDIPEDRDDVFIVDWTYGDTEDYTSFYTDALDELGLTYTIWGLGEEGEHAEGVAQDRHPTFEEMYRHDLVILNANESQVGLQEAGLSGAYQYQNILLSGGSLLIAGQGTQGFWRYLTNGSANPLADTPANRNNYPDTWPYTWGGPSQNVGCEMCIARYFAGYTPGLTATLSNRLLVPYPTAPDRPEMEVRLAQHPEAEGIFDYALDISTGGLAKDGAAGNQYQFNSGSVVSGFKAGGGNDPATPENDAQKAASLGDVVDALIVRRTVDYARPLWSYPVSISTTMGMTDTLNVVGTYVAGQQYEDGPAWNAMYWGFGLEGVGDAGEGTASRSRLLGDTFNFLAKNLAPGGGIVVDAAGRASLTLDLGPAAEPVRFETARIDWGDGRIEAIDLAGRSGAALPRLAHAYASAAAAAARDDLAVTLYPVRGEAAPVHLTIRSEAAPR
ncbi:MAG: S8 family serine peptidase [Chloroflexi bacterium]|nr:S8 family serine peptidase [Chloroflexota bacterium]